MKKLLILVPTLLFLVSMLISCAGHGAAGAKHNKWPEGLEIFFPPQAPIADTIVTPIGSDEYEIDVTAKNKPSEKFKIKYKKNGDCTVKVGNARKVPCNQAGYFAGGIDPNAPSLRKSEIILCTPFTDSEHPVNSTVDVDGDPSVDSSVELHCGKVWYITDGADIQFKAGAAPTNRKCKKVGGKVICY